MSNYLLNPVKGTIQDITKCSDEVFAKKTLGDGFLVIPNDSAIVAPSAGKVKSIFPTKHAITFISEEGDEILIHIGIDTVELEGKGFKQLVNSGDKVEAGQVLMKVDFDTIKEAGYDPACIVIILSKKSFEKSNLDISTNEYLQVVHFNR